MPEFHYPSIGYLNLKFGHQVDIAVVFFNQSPMNKIVGVSTINQNYDHVVLDVTLKFQGLKR